MSIQIEPQSRTELGKPTDGAAATPVGARGVGASLNGLPVIIGAGLSGLVTSIKLSRAKKRHVLIGAPPNNLPRLGESLNLEGSISLLEMFPEFGKYYLTKKLSAGLLGDYALTCDFCLDRRKWATRFLKALDYVPPPGFLHLDRMGLDPALFEAAVADEHCVSLTENVTSLDYDTVTDTIRSVQMANGDVIEPGYVFDATNQGRLIGQAAGVPCQMLSKLHRVVYTHYHSGDPERHEQKTWEHATYVVRMYEPVDPIDGMAWCIPLGNYISIGATVDPEQFTGTDEELLTLVEQAYARRGLHYREGFPLTTTIMPLRHKYFAHERAYGANWLLSGPAYCQVWWMSGSGVGTALASAHVAPDVVDSPLEVGAAYENYLKELLGIHETFDWFTRVDPRAFTAQNLNDQSDLFIRTNVRRLAKSTLIRPNRLSAILGGVFFYMDGARLIRGYCDVERCDLEKQAQFVLAQAQ